MIQATSANAPSPEYDVRYKSAMKSATQDTWDVFISYRRFDGTSVARLLRSELENFHFPNEHPPPGRSSCRVYLDTSYGRSTDDFYEHNILPALRNSRFLLVLLTPPVFIPNEDGKDNWVTRELNDFLTTRPPESVLIVRGRGEQLQSPLPKPLQCLKNPHIVDMRIVSAFAPLRWLRRWKIRESVAELIPKVFESNPDYLPLVRQENAHKRVRSIVFLSTLATTILAIVVSLVQLYSPPGDETARLEKAVKLARLSPDGRLLATISIDGTGNLWEVTGGGEAPIKSINDREKLEDNWRRLLAGNSRPESSALQTKIFEGIDSDTHTILAIAPSSRLAVAQEIKKGVYVQPPSEVTLWDVMDAKRIAVLTHQNPVQRAVFSHDGKLLATAGWWRKYNEGLSHGPIHVWNTQTGELAYRIPIHEQILILKFSPDGKYLVAVAGESGLAPGSYTLHLKSDFTREVHLWDTAEGTPVARIFNRYSVADIFFYCDASELYLVTVGDSDPFQGINLVFNWWFVEPSSLLKDARRRLKGNPNLKRWKKSIGQW